MRKRALLYFVLLLLLTTLTPKALAGKISVPTKQFLMSFNVCLSTTTDCNNPRNHLVLLAQSDDGSSWDLIADWSATEGSVPDIFRRGNTLYLYDTQALTKIDMTTGEFTRTRATLTTGDGFVDPSIAQLADGRLILFYLPGLRGGDPAQCLPSESSCERVIKSAVEVEGSDGTSFTPDPGVRIAATVNPTSEERVFSDPDIFWNGNRWVLYVSRGRTTEAYTSDSLQGSFTNKINLTNGKGGVPSAILDPTTSKVISFTHTNLAGAQVIRRTISSDGLSGASNESDYLTIFSNSSVGSLGYKIVGSPGVAINNVGIDCEVCKPKPIPSPTPSPTPSVSVTPTPTQSPAPAATASEVGTTPSKMKTIACVKGKATKKVTGLNPKCPKGFKKK